MSFFSKIRSPRPEPATLTPGDYLLEIDILGAVSRTTVLAALYNAGFRDFHLDAGFAGINSAYGEGEPRKGAKTRIVSTLTEPAILAHIPDKIRWTLVHKLKVSPNIERATQIGGVRTAFELETGKSYESRLLTRNKQFPTREIVWTTLRMLGHEPVKLVEMKRQVRLPNQPGSLWSEWLAWTKWTGPRTPSMQSASLVFDEIVEM